MGNFWVCFWLIAFWGTGEALHLVGNEGSELKRSQSPHGWNTANEDLFLPILIVGSGTKAPHEQAPVTLPLRTSQSGNVGITAVTKVSVWEHFMQSGSGIVIYKKHISDHSDDRTIVLIYIWCWSTVSGSQLLNWNFLIVESDKGVFVMLTGDLGKEPKDGGWCPWRQQSVYSIGPFSPLPS